MCPRRPAENNERQKTRPRRVQAALPAAPLPAVPLPGPAKPTASQIAAATGATIPDVMAQGLDVLICGINPSLYSAAVGHHFARPGNRFWPALAGAGITPRRLMPWEDQYLAVWGYGLTNLVARATARADELSPEELQAGFRRLTGKLRRYRVGVLAVLGISAYRIALGKPRAVMGPQEETIAGAQVWVLPNPSGLNAHYQLPELSRLYRQLHQAARKGSAPRTRG